MDAAEQVATVRAQLLLMLGPYITTENMPPQLPASSNASWTAPVMRRCAVMQTPRIPLGMLTPRKCGSTRQSRARFVRYVDG